MLRDFISSKGYDKEAQQFALVDELKRTLGGEPSSLGAFGRWGRLAGKLAGNETPEASAAIGAGLTAAGHPLWGIGAALPALTNPALQSQALGAMSKTVPLARQELIDFVNSHQQKKQGYADGGEVDISIPKSLGEGFLSGLPFAQQALAAGSGLEHAIGMNQPSYKDALAAYQQQAAEALRANPNAFEMGHTFGNLIPVVGAGAATPTEVPQFPEVKGLGAMASKDANFIGWQPMGLTEEEGSMPLYDITAEGEAKGSTVTDGTLNEYGYDKPLYPPLPEFDLTNPEGVKQLEDYSKNLMNYNPEGVSGNLPLADFTKVNSEPLSADDIETYLESLDRAARANAESPLD